MEHPQDFNTIASDAIWQQVGRSADNEFARAGASAGSSDVREVGQIASRLHDQINLL
jgi:hypothetical protein